MLKVENIINNIKNKIDLFNNKIYKLNENIIFTHRYNKDTDTITLNFYVQKENYDTMYFRVLIHNNIDLIDYELLNLEIDTNINKIRRKWYYL